jgi:hypothetical protein
MGMASFFAVLATAFITSSAAAEIFQCPSPPPISSTDERFGGGVKAGVLNRFLSSLALYFDVRKVEDDILSRYPNSTDLFQKLTNFSYSCQIILAKSISDTEKLQQLEDLVNRTFGVVLNPAPQLSPSPVPPPPNAKPRSHISSTEASAAAAQLMRLKFGAVSVS